MYKPQNPLSLQYNDVSYDISDREEFSNMTDKFLANDYATM